MSSRRTLSTFPGWDEASKRLLGERGFNKSEIRSLGAWVPPPSIDRVTFVLLRALAHGVVRHHTQIEAQSKLAEPVVSLDEVREPVVLGGGNVVSLRSVLRNRARGVFGPEWFTHGAAGDPTL